MLNLNFVTPKRHFLARNRVMSYRALKSVQSIFLWRTARKKGREGKGREEQVRHKKSRKRYISPIRGEAPCKLIFSPNFAH